MNAAIHARVSTLDQEPENQLQELRRDSAFPSRAFNDFFANQGRS